jgi:hypothetical protein
MSNFRFDLSLKLSQGSSSPCNAGNDISETLKLFILIPPEVCRDSSSRQKSDVQLFDTEVKNTRKTKS